MSLRLAPEVNPERVKSTLDTTHRELGGHDALRYEQWQETQWELKLNLARQAYGMHAPIKMEMEKSIVEKRQRLPVIPNSNLHLDILLGKDETIDYEDFLNDPAMATESLDLHSVMEHKLNLRV
ncbi:unnamed protein product [Mucor hiemalis]